jgi:hypothetical protein
VAPGRPVRSAGAVWFPGGMGLLDEAIREHLELKRRRGADPGEIAHAESSVLAPVPGEEHDLAVGHDEAYEPAPPSEQEDPDGLQAPSDPGWEQASEPAVAAETGEAPTDAHIVEPPAAGQETAELDMSAVLGGDVDEPAPASTASPVGVHSEPPPAEAAPTPAAAAAQAPAAAAAPAAAVTRAPAPAAAEAPAPARKWAGWRRGSREEREPEQQVPEEIPGQERLTFE